MAEIIRSAAIAQGILQVAIIIGIQVYTKVFKGKPSLTIVLSLWSQSFKGW